MRISITAWIMRFFIFLFWIICIGIFLMLPLARTYFKQEKSLTIFTWPLMIDPIYLKNFEKETGIKLYITYFESGSGLLSKLFATNGVGYDLIIPDDHSLELLIKQKLLKKIDRDKLVFWDLLNPILLSNYADPKNEYSIPYYWGVYGVGYNSELLGEQISGQGWSLLFDTALCPNARICMTDDPREAIMVTAQYLFGSVESLKDPANRQQVKNELIKQKKHVEIYSISRSDSLLQSRSCGIAAIMSPDIWRLSHEHPSIKMIIPKEGGFVVVDSLVIPCATQKDELIYELINYLYKKEVIEHHIASFGYCSAMKNVVFPGQETFCPIDRFKNFDSFGNVMSDEEINELWIEVLAS